MKYFLFTAIALIQFCQLEAQTFTISELASMPEPVSNNAVVSAMCGDTLCVYSFCGIDSTKTPQGIHLKAWKYNTISEEWSQLPDVPDDSGRGKIASGASVVNNKIYLIGGYYVADNLNEESSDDVHVFNPETNEWEADGAVIPVPIDDHVQAVWQERLIYIVTGWSDTGNVNDVQIYDPSMNEWMVGNPPPNTNDYTVFGGSGEIVGNKIIYHGGVKGGLQFLPTTEVRKGTINPLDPEDITWEVVGESEVGTSYRAAAVSIGSSNAVYWIGGSALGYNFDGIDYNNTGGVAPYNGIKMHNVFTPEIMSEVTVTIDEGVSLPMDLRGIAKLTSAEEEEQTGMHQSIICGGMIANQEVTNQVILVTSDDVTSLKEELERKKSTLQWHISNSQLHLFPSSEILMVEIFNVEGKVLMSSQLNGDLKSIDINQLSAGMYLFTVSYSNGKTASHQLVK